MPYTVFEGIKDSGAVGICAGRLRRSAMLTITVAGSGAHALDLEPGLFDRATVTRLRDAVTLWLEHDTRGSMPHAGPGRVLSSGALCAIGIFKATGERLVVGICSAGVGLLELAVIDPTRDLLLAPVVLEPATVIRLRDALNLWLEHHITEKTSRVRP